MPMRLRYLSYKVVVIPTDTSLLVPSGTTVVFTYPPVPRVVYVPLSPQDAPAPELEQVQVDADRRLFPDPSVTAIVVLALPLSA